MCGGAGGEGEAPWRPWNDGNHHGRGVFLFAQLPPNLLLVRCKPMPKPSKNKPLSDNLSPSKIRHMGMFEEPILCACMVCRQWSCLAAYFCHLGVDRARISFYLEAAVRMELVGFSRPLQIPVSNEDWRVSNGYRARLQYPMDNGASPMDTGVERELATHCQDLLEGSFCHNSTDPLVVVKAKAIRSRSNFIEIK